MVLFTKTKQNDIVNNNKITVILPLYLLHVFHSITPFYIELMCISAFSFQRKMGVTEIYTVKVNLVKIIYNISGLIRNLNPNAPLN